MVEYYKNELEKRKQELELVEEGAKSFIYEMAQNSEYDFEKIKNYCEQIDDCKSRIKYAETALEEEEERQANAGIVKD